jgi:hypothetical protein
MITKFDSLPQNITKGSKILQLTPEFINIFHLQDPQKIYPNLDFWFENLTSGNPAKEYTP